ncbi:MAG: response regulator [Desulfobacteraceae bacterium]|nr:MAG: response regulator [Desulfobacteraceae bacterium]
MMNAAIRVLLVDDEEAFVRGMARLLKFRGIEVSTALSGQDAVDAVKRESFDVVVLDIKMAGMDGIEALEKIKELAPDTEVIMLTGHASLASGAQALRKGAYDYLMKPCDPEDLIEKIREAHEAENIRRHPVLWPRKLVGEIALHSIRPLLPDAGVREALEAMRRETAEEAVEEVFVLNAQGSLAGVVNKRDLVDLARKNRPEENLDWNRLIEKPQCLPDIPISAIMRADPATTREEVFLTDAANQMILHRARSMPVLRGGEVLGVLKLLDVFRYLEHETE